LKAPSWNFRNHELAAVTQNNPRSMVGRATRVAHNAKTPGCPGTRCIGEEREESFPIPQPRGSEAIVRVRCATVCGSDLQSFCGRRHAPVPSVLGHEMVADIVAAGPDGASDFHGRPLALGDRVTWSMVWSCGECFYCRRGLRPAIHLRSWSSADGHGQRRAVDGRGRLFFSNSMICGDGDQIVNCMNDNENYSFHRGGCNFLYGDGAVRFSSERMNIDTFVSMFTRAAGDNVNGTDSPSQTRVRRPKVLADIDCKEHAGPERRIHGTAVAGQAGRQIVAIDVAGEHENCGRGILIEIALPNLGIEPIANPLLVEPPQVPGKRPVIVGHDYLNP